jgi:hypothetical protein
MTCTSCGAALRPGSLFCGECGAQVDPSAVPAPPPLVVPAARTDPPPPPPVPAVRGGTPPPPAAPPAAPVALARWTPPAPPAPAVPAPEPAAAQPTVPLRGLIDNLPLGLLDRGAAPPPAPPATPAAAPVAAPDPEGDVEETVLAPRRTATWRIVTPAGERHAIRGATVIGRAPAPREGATVLALADPSKSLSKSHALLDVVDDRLVIEDLGSTNGVIVHDGTVELDLPPGERTALAAGVTLELGEYTLGVERG